MEMVPNKTDLYTSNTVQEGFAGKLFCNKLILLIAFYRNCKIFLTHIPPPPQKMYPLQK